MQATRSPSLTISDLEIKATLSLSKQILRQNIWYVPLMPRTTLNVLEDIHEPLRSEIFNEITLLGLYGLIRTDIRTIGQLVNHNSYLPRD